MPAGFRDFFSRNAEIWAPLGFTPEQLARRPDQRVSQPDRPAQAGRAAGAGLAPSCDALAERLKQEYPGEYGRPGRSRPSR